MRTLCLNLQKTEKPSVAEAFLNFSPRVHFRNPGLVFVDVSSTSNLFSGEDALTEKALSLCKDFYPEVTAAIADSPAAAQVASFTEPIPRIVTPNEERSYLGELPLATLMHLEGLVAWQNSHEIEDIISFFKTVGFKRVGDLQAIELEAFRERWGNTGSLLWKRINGQEQQVISPLQPTEALVDYVYLDFPVSLLAFLLHCLEKSLKKLFARLQGRGEFAQKILVHLHCEYSNKYHLIELQPASPNRDLDLFIKLLENKLADLDLENPIKEFEVEIVPCTEKVHQFDFWEPRVRDTDKLQQLVSLFNQASITTGFFQPIDEILPEDSWDITPEFQPYEEIEDIFEERAPEGHDKSFRWHSAYGRSLGQAPRPTRILETPKRINQFELQRLHFLSEQPVERLEDSWWQESRGRDYYCTISPQGECLWVYYDRIENQYYLHGYFD